MKNKSDLGLGTAMLAAGLYLTFGKSVIAGKTLFSTDVYWGRADSYLNVIGLLLAGLSAALLIRALCGRRDMVQAETGRSEKSGGFNWLVPVGFAALLAFVLLLERIGFTLASFLLILSLSFSFRVKETGLRLRDRSAALKAFGGCAAYAAILVLALTFAFTHFLNVALPQ